MRYFMAGITGRLNYQTVLTGDFTTVLNATQDATFDASSQLKRKRFLWSFICHFIRFNRFTW
jgi:OOP family OmpA-OmpF porin